MPKVNYEVLNIKEFGEQLLISGDLDPLYIALVNSQFDRDMLYRWLLAYWCFYHAGVASYLSQFKGKNFWEKITLAARNDVLSPIGTRWERGGERRHFRANNAMNAINYLTQKYSEPEEAINFIVGNGEDLTYLAVSKRTQEHVAFGPWMGFKVADMVDRVLGVSVNFNNTEVFMFKDPAKAAMILWESGEVPNDKYVEPNRDEILELVTTYLIDHFNGFLAPPFEDRPVNIQEIETILCKWKSHRNGHYPLNNDIIAIREGLEKWVGASETAQTLLENMP